MGALFPDRRIPRFQHGPARKGLHPLAAGLLAMAVFMGSSFLIHTIWRIRAIRLLDYPLVAWVEWAGFILVLLLPAILLIGAAEKSRRHAGLIMFLVWLALVAIWIAAWNWRLHFIVDFLYPHWPGQQQYLTKALLAAFVFGAFCWGITASLWVMAKDSATRSGPGDDWSEKPFDIWQASRSSDGGVDPDF